VRELENVMERSLVLASGPVLEEAEVRLDMAPSRRTASSGEPGFLPPGMTLEEYERALIREALRRAGGNKSQAARLLGLTRNALRYRLTQMGEADPESAPPEETP
jgi:DNA-binding NtrC family response regulator